MSASRAAVGVSRARARALWLALGELLAGAAGGSCAGAERRRWTRHRHRNVLGTRSFFNAAGGEVQEEDKEPGEESNWRNARSRRAGAMRLRAPVSLYLLAAIPGVSRRGQVGSQCTATPPGLETAVLAGRAVRAFSRIQRLRACAYKFVPTHRAGALPVVISSRAGAGIPPPRGLWLVQRREAAQESAPRPARRAARHPSRERCAKEIQRL